MKPLWLLLVVAGCSQRPLYLPDPVEDPGAPDLFAPDLSTREASAADLGAADLATGDLAAADLVAGDLATAPDLRTPAGFVALPTEARPNAPFRVVAGDVDGDGRADAVTLNYNSFDVGFYRGRGDGTLEEAKTIALGEPGAPNGGSELAGADLDGDGHFDVVVACDRGAIILRGGAGGLTRGETLAVKDGARSVAIVDLDGDGRLDVIAQGNRRLTALQRADGSFATPRIEIVDGSSFAAGDFDGDGRADLVSGFDARFRRGMGDGSFVDGERVPAAGGGGRLTAGDLDGDGKLDLVTATRLLFGNGDGTFREGAQTGSQAETTRVVDLDGDGARDLVSGGSAANSDPRVSVRFGGDFTTSLSVNPDCSWPRGLDSGDFNRDGVRDLVVACHGNSTVVVVLGQGARGFAAARLHGVGSPIGVVAGDFDGDGHHDVALGSLSGAVTLRRGRGDGKLGVYEDTWLLRGPGMQGIVTDDFDEDGDLDVIATYAWGPMYFLRNPGDGRFSVEQRTGIGFRVIAIGDFDGDRHLDLISSGEGIYFVKGKGDGSFAPAVRVMWAGAIGGTSGDFDGDGRLDVAFAIYQRDLLMVLRGRGDGTFDAAIELAAGDAPFAVEAVDLDGDGALELITPHLDGGSAGVFRARGDGSFAKRVDYAVTPNKLSTLVARDFDGDGELDVVIGSRDPVGVFFLRGRGDGTLAPAVPYSAGAGSIVDELTTGDFDGDGRDDLAGTSIMTNSMTILLNRF